MSDPLWISITAYSQRYGADRKTVHKWLAAGLLESYRVGRFIRVKNQLPVERRKRPRVEPLPTRPKSENYEIRKQ